MIPNPLPYESTKLEVARLKDLSSKSRSILFCGRVHPEKGLELLAKTANALPDGWKLTIVGPWKTAEGGGGEDYLRTLKAVFNEAKVQFLEPIYDTNKLNLLYKDASIFVYPSVAEKGETFGLAPLEAMALGAVPIVSDLDCFKDFIFHDKNGLIFNHRAQDTSVLLMQNVLKLIEDDPTRTRLAKEALKVRVSHSPDSIADLFLADFEKLLS
jgi:glycosyltransferase involved in cell wall biosynthesis